MGGAALLAVLAGLVLFPPWSTVIAGDPVIPLHWAFSPPHPIDWADPPSGSHQHADYRVDVLSLQKRLGVVLLVGVIAGAPIWVFGRRGESQS